MAFEPKESPANNPGLHVTSDEATKGYLMRQTMFRFKYPKACLDFCSRVLGMSNWDTEPDPEFKGYHNGNSEPRGFGHIGITIDDTYKACERFEKLSVMFVKMPEDGKMKGIAFIQDPDDYWIEIFNLKTIGTVTEEAA